MPENDDDNDHNANIAVLVAAVIVVILGALLMHWLSDSLKMERCMEERRRGCDQSDVPAP